MSAQRGWLADELAHRGVKRREFLGFCATMAAALALPDEAAAQIAKAVGRTEKPILIWLEFQDCAGNTESFLRASRPTAAEIVLDLLSVDYHETIMAAAGNRAENRDSRGQERAGSYIAVVEGSIPTGAERCVLHDRRRVRARDRATRSAATRAATIAVGTCASFGGLPAAAPNPTGALSVARGGPRGQESDQPVGVSGERREPHRASRLLPDVQTWPSLDRYRRPLFAYGKSIHDDCERRAHFDAGQYVELWGDDGHRAGYCLYKMGCKGPVTFQNCPNVRWNGGTNWPIGCGHPCIGCSEPAFWDRMTPFYRTSPASRLRRGRQRRHDRRPRRARRGRRVRRSLA